MLALFLIVGIMVFLLNCIGRECCGREDEMPNDASVGTEPEPRRRHRMPIMVRCQGVVMEYFLLVKSFKLAFHKLAFLLTCW